LPPIPYSTYNTEIPWQEVITPVVNIRLIVTVLLIDVVVLLYLRSGKIIDREFANKKEKRK
jgi:hypothetical protein